VSGFASFESAVQGLPLYQRLAACVADDSEVAGVLGAAQPGQARPVLFFAAVHDLVLRRPDLPLARWYPSITAPSDRAVDDPWPTFRSTVLAHRAELESVIATHSTQTNEVNRVVLLAPLLAAACADEPTAAVSFVELGTSAGLLLGFDRYRTDVGGVVVGDEASSVRLAGEVRGERRPDLSTFPTHIAERVGIDLDPVSLDDVDRVRWLEACLWPDQPWRVERFRAAVEVLRRDPPRIVTGDFVDALPGVIAGLAPDTHLIVFDGWALTYVERERRPLVADALAAAAAGGRPVSWVTAEAPRCVPGIEAPPWVDADEESTPDTVLGIRRWRAGHELPPVALGWAHPHGAWLICSP
jgi:hypothetical protein